MNNPFQIDFRKWALLLLPTPLRRQTLFQFLSVLLSPLISLYNIFAKRRDNDNIYARYDSSAGNIQRMLNILFPSGEGRIIVRTIDPTEVEYQRIYITTNPTSNSAYVGKSYIDMAVAQMLFEVIIPSDLLPKKDEINDVVSRYALPGFGYNIILV